jgi:CheY-like chemotaxis protein
MKPGSHILVVDDDAFFRDLLRDVLTEHGFRISEAVNGDEAIKTFDREAADMAIIDLEMPRMNGLDVVRYIKGKNPHFPVIMVTAYAAVHTPADILAAGVDTLLQKPVPMEKLLKIIEQT